MFQSALPVPGRKPGGVDVFVDRLAQRLALRGHDVQMISLGPAPSGARYAHQRLSGNSRDIGLQRLLTVPLRLNRLDTSGLDVLHLHGDDWFFVRRRVPTIRSFYGSALHEARHATRLRRRASHRMIFGLELVSARLATRSYSVGPGWRRLYSLSGTLDCGIELSEASDQQDRSAAPSILFVGTWEGRKRGRFLHDVFLHEVRPRLPDAQLWMVSDECVPADGVKWLYGPSDEVLADLYERAWVFCLPSTYEGFGIPYLEAMARGLPVVSSPNIGSRYVLGRSYAGLVADDANLGAALLRLLADGDRRSRMGQAGRLRAGDFTWRRVLDAHEEAYEQTIAASRRSSA
jgi:phosphatidylinositol alpha-mannosyltransferase